MKLEQIKNKLIDNDLIYSIDNIQNHNQLQINFKYFYGEIPNNIKCYECKIIEINKKFQIIIDWNDYQEIEEFNDVSELNNIFEIIEEKINSEEQIKFFIDSILFNFNPDDTEENILFSDMDKWDKHFINLFYSIETYEEYVKSKYNLNLFIRYDYDNKEFEDIYYDDDVTITFIEHEF